MDNNDRDFKAAYQFQEYPKWVTLADGSAVIAENADEEMILTGEAEKEAARVKADADAKAQADADAAAAVAAAEQEAKDKADADAAKAADKSSKGGK